MKIRYIFLFLIVFQSNAYSQDFSSFYSFLLNRVNINPAYAGNSNAATALMDYRSQYNGISGGPRNLMFCLNSPISVNQGAGIKLIQDSRGAFGVTRVDGLYSYKVLLADSFSVRFGLSVGILNRQINTSKINGANSDLFDLGDPTLSSSAYNYSRFVAGFGFVANYRNFEFAFSAPQIIENAASINQYLTGSAAYNYSISNSKWALQPYVIYQNLPVTKNLIDGGVKATYDKKFMVLADYSNNNTLKSALGVQLGGFGVSYMYEYATGERSTLSSGTHEVFLSVSIQKQPKRLSSVKMEKDLNAIMDYMTQLMKDDANYSREHIKSELEKINKQLNDIMDENTEKNASKVADKLEKIEKQINFLIEKYKL